MQLDRQPEKGAIGCVVTVIPHMITVIGLDELSPANCYEWIQHQMRIMSVVMPGYLRRGVQYNKFHYTLYHQLSEFSLKIKPESNA